MTYARRAPIDLKETTLPDLAVYFDSRGETDTHAVSDLLVRILGAGKGTYSTLREFDPFMASVQILKPFSFSIDQPIKNDGALLLLDGALYPGNDSPRGSKKKQILERLLVNLLAGETERLGGLNGQFNAVAYDPVEKRLVIMTDRLGSRPLYYGVRGNRHLIASELKAVCAVLGDPVRLSSLGLIEFFAFGHNLEHRTVLKNVEVLPPGSIITIDEQGRRTTNYFRYRYHADRFPKNVTEIGERIAETVKEAAPDYLVGEGRNGFFLSGGLDSRIIAGALGEHRPSINTFTFGYPASRDVLYAGQLSGLLGFAHRTFTYPPVYLSDVIRDVVERTECATPFYHTTSLLFHDEIASEADRIIVGFCGDVFSGGHLRSSMFSLSPGPELTGMIFGRALCASRFPEPRPPGAVDHRRADARTYGLSRGGPGSARAHGRS
ncbi:MAG: hypothetical protein KJ645_04585 [Planctomycetes bacterium]|nr:hypothetical protein [Planctomycetota bacterium]